MPDEPSVAYVLKGFPRMSELFIASEIHRLEQTGLPLRLYVIRPRDEKVTHPVVNRIAARPEYLPPTTPLTGTSLPAWLRRNLPAFRGAFLRVARRRPAGLARAGAAALAQALRSRTRAWSGPRKVMAKELLLAVALADRLLETPDVRHLHAHFAHGATSVTWLASLITGTPFSFTAHAKDIYAEKLNPARLLRRKLLAARFAVTCTEANREQLLRIAPEAIVHRVYHGLNADFARLLAEPPDAPARNGTLRVLAVGRLVEKKGFDVLVDAHARLARRGVDAETVVVGDEDGGAFGAVLRRRIARHRLEERVRLASTMSQASLYGEYARASVFCLPCRVLDNGDRDGIPNVLVEAMAAGVPVVTTRVSGIPELVEHGVNGLLVQPDDPAALADALLRLHHDSALRERLVTAAAATVRERFDGDGLANRLAALFREALA
jgi:glycosyltransferase involved in cell wall biosynthesis